MMPTQRSSIGFTIIDEIHWHRIKAVVTKSGDIERHANR